MVLGSTNIPIRVPRGLSGLTVYILNTLSSLYALWRRGAAVDLRMQLHSCAREGYRLGLAESGPYREVLNSDEEIYRGSGVGNGSEVMSEPIPCHGRPHSALFRLPPLGVLIHERLGL